MIKYFWVGFFVICVASRIFTTIYYLEDPDSMRFAYAVKNYDVSILQPHFPGYPVFCFIVKAFYFFSGNVAVSFSIVGGIGIFIISYFLTQIAKILKQNVNAVLLFCLVFFNPFFWILSNRYMPDLMGLAFLISATYFLIKYMQEQKQMDLILFFLLVAILAGIRLSFVPFFIIPCFYVLLKSKNKLIPLVASGIGIAIWFIPLVIDTGFENLLHVAKIQSNGHFNEWGETISSKASAGLRLLKIVETIWADGLGGFMLNRSPLTVIISIGIVGSLAFGIRSISNSSKVVLMPVFLILAGLFVYFLWIYFYQNVVYKARHIIPFLPFLILLMALGIESIRNKWKFAFTGFLIGGYIFILAFLTLRLASQHQSETAIAKASVFIGSQADKERIVVYTTELMQQYFKGSGNTQVHYLDYGIDPNPEIKNYFKKGYTIYSTQKIDELLNSKPLSVQDFYHNPYVNRAWSELKLYHYKNSNL